MVAQQQVESARDAGAAQSKQFAPRERPILFSGRMVRAILAGAKTQTRRTLTPQPEYVPKMMQRTAPRSQRGPIPGWRWNAPGYARNPAWWMDEPGNPFALEPRALASMFCRYGKVGERLWVRETWGVDDYRMIDGIPKDRPSWADHIYFRADGECCEQIPECSCATDGRGNFWRPSIHMPRWASRLTLEIIDVRAERLQSISASDAFAEGIAVAELGPMRCAIDAYAELWDAINGERCPWKSNPWVWVVEFKRFGTDRREGEKT